MATPRSVAIAAAALLTAACVWSSPERQLLQAFFAACEIYDTTAMARFGTATCNPGTDGVVEDFEIVERDADAVTIAARVRSLEGGVQDQQLRVELTRSDRGLAVAAITRLPASRTSPEASSAPPN